MDLSYGDELTVAYKVEFPKSNFQSEESIKVVNEVTAKGENTDESKARSEAAILYEPDKPDGPNAPETPDTPDNVTPPNVQTGDAIKIGGIIAGILVTIGSGLIYIRRRRKM